MIILSKWKRVLTTVILLSIAGQTMLYELTACKGDPPYTNKTPIETARARKIITPVAGHYPVSFFHNPYDDGKVIANNYIQTLTWSPEVTGTFQTNTEYTATVRMSPANSFETFAGISLERITNLPATGTKTVSYSGDDVLVSIVFPVTDAAVSRAQLVFKDDFNGSTDNNLGKWRCAPQWNRKGLSTWQKDQVLIRNNQLVLSFEKRASLAPSGSSQTTQDNWIAAGAVRTRDSNQTTGKITFEHGYGYYEARIKFPQVPGMWGAFWLIGPTVGQSDSHGVIGTEIDIVETYNSFRRNGFTIARYWNGYGSGIGQHYTHTFYDGNELGYNPFDQTGTSLNKNIYDGEFHIFALEWTPTRYIFYLDDEVIYHEYALPKEIRGGIAQNPCYLKLTVEAAPWAYNGTVAADYGEMIVDWVRVYNGPKPSVEREPNSEYLSKR